MDYLTISIISAVAFASGYFVGRENTIKLCRRLYNLNTDLNLVFAEHTEKDRVFKQLSKEKGELMKFNKVSLRD